MSLLFMVTFGAFCGFPEGRSRSSGAFIKEINHDFITTSIYS